MESRYWRPKAREAINVALVEGKAKGLSDKELESYVRKNGYPFGQRQYHPYKIWLSEVRSVFKKEQPPVKPVWEQGFLKPKEV